MFELKEGASFEPQRFPPLEPHALSNRIVERSRLVDTLKTQRKLLSEYPFIQSRAFYRTAQAEGYSKLAPGYMTKIDKDLPAWSKDAQTHLHKVLYLASFGGVGVVSDMSAAALWGLPRFTSWPKKVQRVNRKGTACSQTKMGRVRSTSVPIDLLQVGGLEVTSVAQTVVDIARLGSIFDAVVAGDAALHDGLCTMDQLSEVLESHRNCVGIRKARGTIRLLDIGSESPGETMVRLRLIDSGFKIPLTQLGIGVGGKTYFADLAYLETGVIIEFDGWLKYDPKTNGGASMSDADRREHLRERDLRAAGLTIHRITWADIQTRAAFQAWLRREKPNFPQAK